MRGSVTRRGEGTWRIRIYLGRGPDGAKQYLSRTTHGTRAEADQACAKMLLEVGHGHHRDTGHTMLELTTRWLTGSAPDLSPSTVRDYRYALDRHIHPHLGPRTVTTIRPAELEAWYRTLPIGPARVRRIHNILSSAFDQAVRWQWAVTNPCDFARPPKLVERQVRPPEPAEVRRLHDLALQTDPDLACYIRLATHTGARRGELVALQWSDINLDHGEATIARSVVATAGGGVAIKRTKTGRVRVVSLDDDIIGVLRAQRTRQKERALAVGATPTDGPVFSSDPEGRTAWYPDSVSRRFVQLCRRAGIEGVRLHDLRHFTATQMIAAGVDPRTVAGRLGHGVTTLLDRYSHFVPAADKAAADGLGQRLWGD